MITIRSLALSIIFIAIMGMVSTSWAAYPQTLTSPYPWVNMSRPADDPRWAKAFGHWDQRSETKQVLAAIATIEEIARDKPGGYDAQLWLCRMNFLMAMRKRDERDAYCKKSIAAGDRALKIKPGDMLARYWRFNSLQLLRDMTEEEYQQFHEIALKYRHVRPLPVPDSDPELWAEALKKWDARMDREQALATIEDFKKLEAKHPDRTEPKIYLAQSYFWLSRLETTKERIAELNLIGVEYARKAVRIEPRNPAANFVVALNLGAYAGNKSVVVLVRHSIEIARSLQVVIEENPTHFYGGFSRYIAESIAQVGELAFRVCAILGFPEDQVNRVTIYSTKLEPACFDNLLPLAKMYIILDRMEEGKEMLEKIINGDPSVLKYYEPENRMDQKEAQKIYDKHFK